jgi:hypothetical protein
VTNSTQERQTLRRVVAVWADMCEENFAVLNECGGKSEGGKIDIKPCKYTYALGDSRRTWLGAPPCGALGEGRI